MIRAYLLCIVVALMPIADAAAETGLQPSVRFDSYTPLTGLMQMEKRLLSPLTAAAIRQSVAARHQALNAQPIDLTKERFAVYVPPVMPAKGYGLLVFVPPWDEATVPSAWIAQLNKHAIIFVTAAKSGNAEKTLDRREPLALLAAYNIMQRYRVDPARVYIGGFSGGSRVALRLALAYPDLFRGALLDAGSDPIGNAQIHLPPADLMRRFQESSRLVYMTGESDGDNMDTDESSRRSLHDWCVFGTATVPVPWTGHALAGAAAFAKALDALELHVQPDAEKLSACRAKYEQELDNQLRQIERLQANGKNQQAIALARKIYRRFGGLAAPAQP